MKQQILEILQAKHDSTAGHCGVYIHKLGLPMSSIRKDLVSLVKQNKVTYHDGVHGVMFKIKL